MSKKVKKVYISQGETVKKVKKVLSLYADDDIVEIIPSFSPPTQPFILPKNPYYYTIIC